MGKITRHPLFSKADALKSAFMLNGFLLYDNGVMLEIETSDWISDSFQRTEEIKRKPILLADGSYALRSELLMAQLSKIRNPLPIRAIAAGRVFDGNDAFYPGHLVIEGVLASEDITLKEYTKMWEAIARKLYGMEAEAVLTPLTANTYKVEVSVRKDTFVFAHTGLATNLTKALLGTDSREATTWIFELDVDAITIHDYQLEGREALYDQRFSFISQYECDSPALGDCFANKVTDALRAQGYVEFIGDKLYRQPDCYEKMNMIMEDWDINNKGIPLAEPLGDKNGLPTVLVPALQQALAANQQSGEEAVKIFEIGHIFLPGTDGEGPEEKLAVSIGAYGSDMDKAKFRKSIDQFLSEIGISNHFFIPTTMAIPYDPGDCWIVLDETMSYLGGNFGSICQKALDNQGIGVPAYMAQFEIGLLKDKAEKEYRFTPPELA